MITARTAIELDRALVGRRDLGVSFVPTMGSLHSGHASLVEAASKDSGVVVASVFVNPTQFGQGEDFERYPRDETRDALILEQSGCDILFAPQVDEVYPTGFQTSVSVSTDLTTVLCGASRGPEHFTGVSTVVARLFGLVRPTCAYFGEKDWQQVAVIRAMSTDIFPSIEIRTGPTIRDSDGLALSSRNAYLSEVERTVAAAVPRCLEAMSSESLKGTVDPEALITIGEEILAADGLVPEYLEIRDEHTLRETTHVDGNARVFIAAPVGTTRLIDNALLLNSAAHLTTKSANRSTATGASTAIAAATIG